MIGEFASEFQQMVGPAPSLPRRGGSRGGGVLYIDFSFQNKDSGLNSKLILKSTNNSPAPLRLFQFAFKLNLMNEVGVNLKGIA
jgi:hypothetical protein